ncbi:MAG: hypothetical protein GAS50_03930 [Desulfobacterales bacterium]|nr:hypothetical protein [Desulfobacterales bacterium]
MMLVLSRGQKSAIRTQNIEPHLHDTWQWRLAERGIQGTSGQIYLPTEIQKMLEDAGRIRIQLL